MASLRKAILHSNLISLSPHTYCDTKLMKNPQNMGYSVDQHRIHPPLELQFLMQDLETSDLTNTAYPLPKSWNFSGRTWYDGLVYGDYRCIPQGYRLVLLICIPLVTELISRMYLSRTDFFNTKSFHNFAGVLFITDSLLGKDQEYDVATLMLWHVLPRDINDEQMT